MEEKRTFKNYTPEEIDNFLNRIINQVESMIEDMNKSNTVQSTPDMLTGTGLTEAIPIIDPSNMQIDEIPNEPVPEINNNPQNVGITRPKSNGMNKKPMTFTPPKKNSQSGFAEVIALGVIVLVYVAIIVNLIIRLK